jgi:hypothetical protein
MAAGTLKVKGFENLHANLRVIADRYPRELGYALKEEGAAIMEQSNRECPFDEFNDHIDGTPHLIETANLAGPVFEDTNITVTLSYDTPYAVLQHETLSYHHTFPGTKAKYLEGPFADRARFIVPNLIRAVDIERMGGQYFSTPTVGVLESQMESNKRQQTINRYGHLLGRFV